MEYLEVTRSFKGLVKETARISTFNKEQELEYYGNHILGYQGEFNVGL